MLKIYGASDDLVELDGFKDGVIGKGEDEIGCYSKNVTITVGGVPSPGGVVVKMHYEDAVVGGCWSAEISQVDEGVPIPWPVTVRHADVDGPANVGLEAGYTVVVEIDAPDGTPVKWKTGEA